MLDFLNLQIVSIVSDLVNLRLEKKPNYDFRNMLGGTTVNLGLAIKNGLTSPSILLRSWMVIKKFILLFFYIYIKYIIII